MAAGATSTPLPDWAREGSIPARLAAVVRAQPGRLALRDGARELTYGELGARVARLSGAVTALGTPAEHPIAVVLPHGLEAVVAFLGVMAAGRVVVPLDPAYPPARLRALLHDSLAAIVLTDAERVSAICALAPASCAIVDTSALPDPLAAPDPQGIDPGAPAIITYTSGSTGEPKGVVYPHRMQRHNAGSYAGAYAVTPDDRFTMLHSVAFSSGQIEALIALLTGASLHLLDPRRQSPVRIAQWLDDEAITVYTHVPSAFRLLAPVLAERRPPRALRLVALGSEPVRASDLALFQRAFAPPCRMVARLGSSEVGNIALWFADHRTVLSDGLVPAGYPMPDREVLLVDEAGRAVAPGEVGEIAVRSHYLLLGYWRQPERSAAAFRPDGTSSGARVFRMGDLGRWLPDGCLVHLGRADSLVKIRGHRVELGAVERALLDAPDVADAIVLPLPRADGEQRLVAWVVPRDGAGLAASELAAALRGALPEAGVPSAFVVLNALPRNPNGKVDRAALPAPALARPTLATAFAAPGTRLEREVAAIWAEALALAPIGLDDDFLELGGHSLTAARIATRVEEALAVALGPHELLAAPTVRAMVEVVLVRGIAELPPDEAEALLRDAEPGPG